MYQQKMAEIKNAIDTKKCIVCKNTYTVNDQVVFCSFSHNCVDSNSGEQCEHWEPLGVM
jgi:hypothetical protein